MKRSNIPIDVLYEECIKAVRKEIRKDCYQEAKEIIKLASDEDCREFLRYFKEDKGNICCLVLDRIKRDLIAEGKITLNENDNFGKPLIW
jgi:hypothetical protein